MPHLYPVVIPGGRSVQGLSLGFRAYSLRIDNLSNQWLQEESSLAWIPPYSLGTSLRLYGTAVAIILSQAPQGQPQPTPIAGEYAAGFYSDELRTEVPGVPVRQFTIVQAVSDLTQGPEPGFPPVGVDRLWADTSGLIHHLHSNGVDTILTDPLQTGVVSGAMIADGNVGQAKLFKPSVGTAELFDLNVTTAKLQDSNVTQAKLAKPSVGTAELFDLNVTTAKIQDSNVTAGKLAAGAALGNLVTGTISRVVYDASVAGDQWSNAAFVAGNTSVPAHPVTVSVDTDAQYFIVMIDASAQIVAPQTAGLVAGWDFAFQNALHTKLSRAAYVGGNFMLSCTATIVVTTVGAGAYQFGLWLYADRAGANGLYLLCASVPLTYYVRMQIVEVRR
jgi:hypothetical protein